MSSSAFYFLMILVMIIGMLIQWNLKSKFKRYSKEMLTSGMTGAQVAQKMLYDNGINDVQVIPGKGTLTDHYNPATKTIKLSEGVYASNSVAAAAVAAHETGHAIQHAQGYAALRLRSAMVPVVTFASNLVTWILLAGIILINVFPSLLLIGIILFAATTLFSIVTLPVEIDASKRAIAWLDSSGVTTSQQLPQAQSALRSAAYTYVVAAIGSILTLLYYISIYSSRR